MSDELVAGGMEELARDDGGRERTGWGRHVLPAVESAAADRQGALRHRLLHAAARVQEGEKESGVERRLDGRAGAGRPVTWRWHMDVNYVELLLPSFRRARFSQLHDSEQSALEY